MDMKGDMRISYSVSTASFPSYMANQKCFSVFFDIT